MITRFYDGDTGNNVHCWDDIGAGNPDCDPVWGGDFKGLIDKAVGAGLISGSLIGTDEAGAEIRDLDPKGATTGAQLATILQRFCEGNDL